MEPNILEKRVIIVEQVVDMLRELPARVEAIEGQILQLRTESRTEFSSVRTEMATEFAAVRTEIKAGDEETRSYMRVLHEDTLSRIAVLAEGHEETRRQLIVLHENAAASRGEVLARFTTLEAYLTRPRRKR